MEDKRINESDALGIQTKYSSYKFLEGIKQSCGPGCWLLINGASTQTSGYIFTYKITKMCWSS